MLIAKNFPDSIKDKNLQIQEAKWIPITVSKRNLLKQSETEEYQR